MEPLKPETRARILDENPQAAPEEIDEYERLLAERFATDPDLPPSPEAERRESRLAELYRKLFPQGHGWLSHASPRAR